MARFGFAYVLPVPHICLIGTGIDIITCFKTVANNEKLSVVFTVVACLEESYYTKYFMRKVLCFLNQRWKYLTYNHSVCYYWFGLPTISVIEIGVNHLSWFKAGPLHTNNLLMKFRISRCKTALLYRELGVLRRLQFSHYWQNWSWSIMESTLSSYLHMHNEWTIL